MRAQVQGVPAPRAKTRRLVRALLVERAKQAQVPIVKMCESAYFAGSKKLPHTYDVARYAVYAAVLRRPK